MKSKDINVSKLKLAVILLIVFIIGFLLNSGGNTKEKNIKIDDHKTEIVNEWTCSMHPKIRSKKKGDCPLCGMDLIIVEQSNSDDRPVLKLSDSAIRLADIRTTPVKYEKIVNELAVSGQVEISEKKIKHITAWTDGRIERIYADSTGLKIRKGKPILELYSPEFIISKEELLQTEPGSRNRRSSIEKLKLLGFTDKQIKQIIKKNNVSNLQKIYSPLSGTVIKKYVSEGEYVKKGQRLYTIADLRRLWVIFDVFEQDIEKIFIGQKVILQTEGLIGQIIESRISFIDPVLDKNKRTVRVRSEIINKNSRLKPEMFVKGKINAETSNKVLIIPDTAPLITGRRAIVYILKDKKNGIFEGRQILLGHKVNNLYIVLKGLKENDLVVTNGSFKIDSDLQLKGKPSMMSMNVSENDNVFGTYFYEKRPLILNEVKKSNKKSVFRISDKTLGSITRSYFNIQIALSNDNYNDGKKESDKLLKTIKMYLKGKQQLGPLLETIYKMVKSPDINELRVEFEPFTKEITKILDRSEYNPAKPVYRFHCPMAFDNRGAYWLQDNKNTRNPYFGSSMLICKDEVIKLYPKNKKE